MNKQKIQRFPIAIILLICLGAALLSTACGKKSTSTPTSPNLPTASFTVSTDTGSYPLTVSFDASASADSDGEITGYDWQFGDGATDSGATVTHVYNNAGSYTATLTVTDDGGHTGTFSRNIEVTSTFSLSGTVTAAEYTETDSDINDFNAPYTSNDSFSLAQAVSAPVSISGYVNLPFWGNWGRSWLSGDTADYYSVTLTQGMNITLYIAADTTSSELNLYLWGDDQETLKDMTFTDANGTASLTVQEPGSYFIEVEASDDPFLRTATVYVLNIGISEAASAGLSPRLSDNFVPGEVLVRFEDRIAALSSNTETASDRLSSMGFYTNSATAVRDKLWKLPEGIDKAGVFTSLGIQQAMSASLGNGRAEPATVSKLDTLQMVRALRRTDGVELAEPNYIRKALLVEPNDTYYHYQWHFPFIGLPEAWETTTGSSNVVVAVIDTGILSQHPDLQGQLVAGYDFISDPASALDGNGIDDDPRDPGDQANVDKSSSFHGTHTAGTIAARSNNGSGVAGIAWDARVMPLRALGKGGEGSSYDILEAVRYAAGMETNAGVQPGDPVDIINLSLGGPAYSSIEQAVYREARNQGVLIIASAGNDGTNTNIYPAGYDGVVAVSAVTIEGTPAAYSNYGSTIDIAAPGGSSTDVNGDGYLDGVLSTAGDDSSGTIKTTYAFYTGTSMAAPHVAGVAALMKSVYPGMTPDNFDSLLAGGYLTQNYSDTGPDERLGYGIIDAGKAVLVAEEAGSGSIPPILSVEPRTLNFGRFFSNLNLTVSNAGGGSLSIDDYYADKAWVSITPSQDVDSNGLGTYSISVARNELADGIYTATITFVADNQQQIQVSAVVQVGTGSVTSAGGYYYVVLVNADSLTTAQDFNSSGENGSYAFNFSGLSYGDTYYVYAGTDPNNDGYICTEGEACGAYLSLDKPVKLTIQGNLENIDFITDININIPVTQAGQPLGTGLLLQENAARQIPGP